MTNRSGATLIELLIAVLVFSLIAAAGYTGVNALSRVRSTQLGNAASLESIQWLVARLDRDLFHAINRPIRVFGSERAAALTGDEYLLTLTHIGNPNPLQQPRSDLQRVDWRIDGQRLIRDTRIGIDGSGTNMVSSEVLTESLTGGVFEYLSPDGGWQGSWPAGSNSGLPLAVRYRLDLDNFGAVRRVVELAGPRQ